MADIVYSNVRGQNCNQIGCSHRCVLTSMLARTSERAHMSQRAVPDLHPLLNPLHESALNQVKNEELQLKNEINERLAYQRDTTQKELIHADP